MLHYALFLSGFNFNIEYRESKKNGNADFVSRFPLPAKISDDDSDIHLIMHIETLENFPITVNEIRRETRKDAELATLFNSLQKGDNLVNSPYQHLNGELGIENGCIIRGIRTLIPKKLQSKILDELHSGHFGICKMKELAQQYCYWRNIDADIEERVKNCTSCQNKLANPKQVHHFWEYTSRPWSRLHIDFAEFNKVNFLVVIDSYSKWLEVVKMSSTTASATIRALKELFAIFGLPSVIVSDNGSQFHSEEFSKFLKRNGIKGKFSAPYHPATNSQAEHYVQTVKNALKADTINDDFEDKLFHLLIQYQKMPNATTGRSPAEMLLNRNIRTRIDLIKENIGEKVTEKSVSSNHFRKFFINDPVLIRMYNQEGIKWQKGIIFKYDGLLYYVCKLSDGSMVRRHVDQICKGEGKETQDQDSSIQNHGSGLVHRSSLDLPAVNLETMSMPVDNAETPEENPADSSYQNVATTENLEHNSSSQNLENCEPILRRSIKIRKAPERLNL